MNTIFLDKSCPYYEVSSIVNQFMILYAINTVTHILNNLRIEFLTKYQWTFSITHNTLCKRKNEIAFY